MFKLEVNSHSKIKSNVDFSIGTTLKKKPCMGQILLFQKLPGESGMEFTTAISSMPIFVGGKRHITNPSEKISKRSRPNKWMET